MQEFSHTNTIKYLVIIPWPFTFIWNRYFKWNMPEMVPLHQLDYSKTFFSFYCCIESTQIDKIWKMIWPLKTDAFRLGIFEKFSAHQLKYSIFKFYIHICFRYSHNVQMYEHTFKYIVLHLKVLFCWHHYPNPPPATKDDEKSSNHKDISIF